MGKYVTLLALQLAATCLNCMHPSMLTLSSSSNRKPIIEHCRQTLWTMANVTPKPHATSPSTYIPTFTVLYFAAASSYTARSSEELPAPVPLAKLFPTLESRYPGITAKVLKSCAVTVNLEYVDIEEDSEPKPDNVSKRFLIKPGDEVGIIPPVSSG